MIILYLLLVFVVLGLENPENGFWNWVAAGGIIAVMLCVWAIRSRRAKKTILSFRDNIWYDKKCVVPNWPGEEHSGIGRRGR